MIKSVTIGSFKGVGTRVTFDLKPITLLFGANSAGKSTVLQALLYLHSILEHRTPATDTESLRRRGLDLGGFRNVLHKQSVADTLVFNEEQAISLSVTVIPDDDVKLRHLAFEGSDGLNERLVEETETLTLTVVVAWSDYLEAPFVREYAVAVNGDEVAGLRTQASGSGVELAWHPGLDHPLFPGSGGEELLDGDLDGRRCLAGEKQALPRWGESLHLDDLDVVLQKHGVWSAEGLRQLDALVVGTGSCVRDELARLLHVGPLRGVPPRWVPEHSGHYWEDWSTGVAAWRALARDEKLVRRASQALEQLGTGYGLTRVLRRTLDEDGFGWFMLHERSNEDDLEAVRRAIRAMPTTPVVSVIEVTSGLKYHPAELGVGIGQVVPVIAAANVGELPQPDGRVTNVGLVCIEQPELHLHPAAQTELGDLFIRAVQPDVPERRPRQFLIETHSEHLILRLLRRIRETTDQELPGPDVALAPDDLAIYWVEKSDGDTANRQIGVDADGEFTDRWPRGFFGERLKEL